MGIGFCRGFKGQVDHPHLWAVAVRHHHLVAVSNQVDNRLRGLFNGLHLPGQIVAQRVSAQSEYDFFTHDILSLNGYSAHGNRSGRKRAAPQETALTGDAAEGAVTEDDPAAR